MSVASEALYKKLSQIPSPLKSKDSWACAKINISMKNACNALVSAEKAQSALSKIDAVVFPDQAAKAQDAVIKAKQSADNAERQSVAAITATSRPNVEGNVLHTQTFAEGAEQQNAIAQKALASCSSPVMAPDIDLVTLINSAKTIEDIKAILLRMA